MASTTRTGGRGFGLPPTSKFRSGHLPSRPGHVSAALAAEDSRSASDDDVSTDSEGEIYGGRYSLDSSPQDNRVPSTNGRPSQGKYRYASGYLYSDVSSSVETIVGRQGNLAERLSRGNGKYLARRNDYTEDDSSDSAASSEFSSTQVGSNNGGVPPTRLHVSGGYTSSIPSRFNAESAVNKNMPSRSSYTGQVSDEEDFPSAPPLSVSAQGNEQGSKVRVSGTENTQLPSTQNRSIRSETCTVDSMSEVNAQGVCGNETAKQFMRTKDEVQDAVPSGSVPARVPTFHASSLGPWHAVISYDACVRLCLHAWARGCMEAPMFLDNECALLRDAFGLQQTLLQSEEELLSKRSTELPSEKVASKPKKIIGKMKVQVRKVRMSVDPPTGCSMSSLTVPAIKIESIRYRLSKFQSAACAGWQALRKIHFSPKAPRDGSFSRQSLAYVQASTQYIKQVSGLLKVGVTTLRQNSSSYDAVQETYTCLVRLKSSSEDDSIRMQPGSGETHVFFPDSLGDDLIIEVQDSKGKQFGRVLAQVATISEDQGDKLRWWSIFREPEHELVGKIQMNINYTTSLDDNNLKCGSVAETVAYDLLMEVAMKVQSFQQRNLLLSGSWKWLLTEFASYYGVSFIYTKLRYVNYIMEVATPTSDCLNLVYDSLLPVFMKGPGKSTLSHQENRILGEIKDQLEHILALVFENYKSLDESSLSGIMDVFKPATGIAAPALEPAVKLYKLLHDVLSPEAQTNLCQHFQVAAKKRSRRHLAETDEYLTNSSDANFMDTVTMCTAYQKMKSLCLNIRNEIFTDIEIHNQHILPSFVDLPSLSSSIYSTEICNRLRAFLIACPPTGPSAPVAELVIATSDLQRDIASWGISPVKGGVDAKELFHLYIMVWIQDKRLTLLEKCKLDKVKWSGVKTQHSTTPFIDDMYDRLKETLNDYEIIIRRWPEYIFALENAIADIEKAIVEALEKQYADVLAPLKDNLAPKKFGLKYVQKLAKKSSVLYIVPDELGILLNSMKRMLDVLRPRIESQLKSWGSCIQDVGNTAPGERLSEVTVMLRAKFRNYMQAVVELLAENTKLQGNTKLKKILQDSKDSKNDLVESDVRSRMQPLSDQLTNTINHLHTVFEKQVFIAICKVYWQRMGQDVLKFLEDRKENRSWYKGSRVAVTVLDDTFASQMQRVLGNLIQEKDLEIPRSIMEVRSILCKDAPNHKDSSYYY